MINILFSWYFALICIVVYGIVGMVWVFKDR